MHMLSPFLEGLAHELNRVVQAVRSEKLAALQVLEAELKAMQAEIAQYADSDPKKLEAMRAPGPACSVVHPNMLLHVKPKHLPPVLHCSRAKHPPVLPCYQHACALPIHLLFLGRPLCACAGEATGIAKAAANRWLGESLPCSCVDTPPGNMAHTTAVSACCEAAC